jgi:hypothetical protein
VNFFDFAIHTASGIGRNQGQTPAEAKCQTAPETEFAKAHRRQQSTVRQECDGPIPRLVDAQSASMINGL